MKKAPAKAAALAMHGDIKRDEKAGSAKQFGWVFAAVFALLALLPLLHGGPVRAWALAIAAVFATITLAAPQYLEPLNKLWHKFGLLLHHVVSPLVMGILFFIVMTPMGLMMRAKGTRLLALGYDKSLKSYWVTRTPPGPAPQTFEDQF